MHVRAPVYYRGPSWLTDTTIFFTFESIRETSAECRTLEAEPSPLLCMYALPSAIGRRGEPLYYDSGGIRRIS